MMERESNEIKLVLFDLGGVLVKLGENPFPKDWFQGNINFDLNGWALSAVAKQFETGLISANKFASDLKQQLLITASEKEILEAFARWPEGLFPDTYNLIKRLELKYQLAVLSNANETHEPVLLEKFGLKDMIENIFFSHLIGHSKPSPEAFNYVLEKLNYSANQIIFFDDNKMNVQTARQLGMRAYQVFCPSDVCKYI